MESPFKVMKQNDPRSLEIRYKDKGTINIIETDEGFIIDVYNKPDEECVATMTIWNDDLENY